MLWTAETLRPATGAANEPYRRLPGDHHYIREGLPWFYLVDRSNHKPYIASHVTGTTAQEEIDVRSLSLMYQENMRGTCSWTAAWASSDRSTRCSGLLLFPQDPE
ncbi:hypothetical protein SORBI_3004G020150 [Sorghum bicolor]|uniref:Uncharacterized protein n=1 Tax=Sorghum bicolor TaxID=4558 RepID=C5XT18_SORBI|nr:hypothetical protein SORBI_3004G020150 [Sorghum bicolor]